MPGGSQRASCSWEAEVAASPARDLRRILARSLRHGSAHENRPRAAHLPGADLHARITTGPRQAACCCSRTTWRSAPAPSTPRLSCARWARSRGAPPTCSPRAARPTAATARTRSGCSTTTSTRWSSSPRRCTILDLYLGSLAGARPRPAGARRALRRGQLGVAHARRVGPRLGGVAERHGDHAVHLLPAGRRPRLPAGDGRDHLRARAARHVPAGRREHLRHRLERGAVGPRHLRRRVPPERGRAVRLQLRARRRRDAAAPLRGPRARVPAACSRRSCRCRRTSRCSRPRTPSTCWTRARAISVTERQRYILRVRTLASAVARAYLASREALGFPLLKAPAAPQANTALPRASA